MWLHKYYRRILGESTRSRIRNAGRRVMPIFFEKMRAGVLGPEAVQAVPPASAAMVAPAAAGSKYDELYYARRNPLIQSMVGRIEAGEPLEGVLGGFNACEFDERVLYIAACAEWLKQLPDGVEVVDVSGTAASKMLNLSFAGKCGRVCFANFDDATSTVMRTWVGSRSCDGYQRFPAAYEFGGAVALWCRPRKQFNLVLSGFTIPGKNALFLRRPLEDVCARMSRALPSGGRLLVGVVDEQADPAAVEAAVAKLGESGVRAQAQWLAATADGWRATPKPLKPVSESERGEGECALAAIIRGTKE